MATSGHWDILVPEVAANKTRNSITGESAVVGSELLSNAGFEIAGGGGADVFASWTEAAGGGTIVDEGVIVSSGSHAAKLTAGAAADTWVLQSVAVTPGKLYRGGFFTRGDGADAGRYAIYDVTNAAFIINYATTGVTAAAYAYKEVCVIAPAGCVSMRMYLRCSATTAAVTYFDDISLLEVNIGLAHLGDVADYSRSTTYSRYGPYSNRVVTAADNEGAVFALDALTNAAHYITMRVLGTLPAAWDWSLDDSTYTAPTKIADIDATWSLYGLALVAGQANGSTGLWVRQNGAGSGTFYLDGIDVVAAAHWTTHVDGTQEGCEWDGEAHDSSSSRSAVTRAGGRWQNLYDDYGVIVQSYLGVGKAPRSTGGDGYSQLPGGALNASVRMSRTFTLVSFINSTTFADLLDKRNALSKVLDPEAYPKGLDDKWQPIRIRNTAGTTYKTIAAHYEGGLETDQTWALPINERAAIRFFAPDPNWYEVGESSQILDTNDTATLRYLAGRLKSTGQWDDLGLTANPTANGTCYTVLVARDKSVYFGGNFDGIDNDTPAGGDFVIRWDPSDQSLNLLVGASDIGDQVYILSEGPDGKIYIGGIFTQVDGDAGGDADYIIVYNPSSDTWEKLGVPNTGAAAITSIDAMAWDSAGNLYIGGVFTNFADVAAADYFAKWDGTNWSAVGSGGISAVYAIAIDKDDNIYIGGTFAAGGWAGDPNAQYWAWWNGIAWSAVDDIALNGAVGSLIFDARGDLYVGGVFTNADSNANADRIFKWTGAAVEALDTGVNGDVNNIVIAQDGLVLVFGSFTTAGGLSTIDRSAAWTGSSWVQYDTNLPGSSVIYAGDVGKSDPATSSNYDIYLAFDTTGSGYFSGSTTVTNSGTATVYPQIIMERSGSGSARLVSIRNWITGVELYFDYSLVDGETLTIDLHPDKQTIVSDFYGARLDALLAGSDLGEFSLLAGDNTITAFVDYGGAPSVSLYMLWRDAYDGIDD